MTEKNTEIKSDIEQIKNELTKRTHTQDQEFTVQIKDITINDEKNEVQLVCNPPQYNSFVRKLPIDSTHYPTTTYKQILDQLGIDQNTPEQLIDTEVNMVKKHDTWLFEWEIPNQSPNDWWYETTNHNPSLTLKKILFVLVIYSIPVMTLIYSSI